MLAFLAVMVATMRVTICLAQQPAQIMADTPLYMRITKRTSMRVGAVVHGVLTRPLWVKSQLVFPEGTAVQGQVVQLSPIPCGDHIKSLLEGDFTPQKAPVIDFNSIETDGVRYQLHTVARVQNIEMVRFVATPHRFLPHEAKTPGDQIANDFP